MPLVQSAEQLAEVVGRAERARAVAIDTEFVWEKTYYPRLGLVQLNLGDDDIVLIDAATLDITPLGTILADRRITKVLHDASQDLIILSRATGAQPRSVFDTQLAAGFVGLSATLSLQALVDRLLGVHLPKGVTRSDWLQRPLTEEQIEYARADVRHLLALYQRLEASLEQKGRGHWASAEMQQFDEPFRYADESPRERYLATRGRGKRRFGGREWAILREVAAWREELARSSDRPRQHVVTDDLLITISQKRPSKRADLDRLGLPGSLRSSDRDALLAAVRRGLETPRDEWPERPEPQRDDPALMPRIDLVQAVIRGAGEREGVDPQIVATRMDVERFVREYPKYERRLPLVEEWRREFIGADLEALMAGRVAVRIGSHGLPVIDKGDPGASDVE